MRLDMMIDWLGAIESEPLAAKVTRFPHSPSQSSGRSADARWLALPVSDQRVLPAVGLMEEHLRMCSPSATSLMERALLSAILNDVSRRILRRHAQAFYSQLRLERAERLLTY